MNGSQKAALDVAQPHRDEIEAIKRRMDRNAHAHIGEALRLQHLNAAATFVATIGGAAIMALSAALLMSENSGKELEICLAVVSGLITLVGIWQAIWRPGERALEHKAWSAQFGALEDECRLALCGIGEHDLTVLAGKASFLSTSVDLIPEHIWRRRRRPAKGQG